MSVIKHPVYGADHLETHYTPSQHGGYHMSIHDKKSGKKLAHVGATNKVDHPGNKYYIRKAAKKLGPVGDPAMDKALDAVKKQANISADKVQASNKRKLDKVKSMKESFQDNPFYSNDSVAEAAKNILDEKVAAYDKDGKQVGLYRNMADAKKLKPGHTYKVMKEGVDLEEGLDLKSYGKKVASATKYQVVYKGKGKDSEKFEVKGTGHGKITFEVFKDDGEIITAWHIKDGRDEESGTDDPQDFIDMLKNLKEEVDLEEARSTEDRLKSLDDPETAKRFPGAKNILKRKIRNQKSKDAKHASRRSFGSKDSETTMSLAMKKAKNENVDLEEASDIYHKHMLKALGKSRLPKNHQYTSEVSKTTGDFIVRDGGSRVVARLKKGEHSLGESAVAWSTRQNKWANKYKGGFKSKEDAEKHYQSQKETDKNTKVHISQLKPDLGEVKKLDPVDKKDVKGKFKDREDKDIDNDGDADSTDKYLHKRRKAVTKAVDKTKKKAKSDDGEKKINGNDTLDMEPTMDSQGNYVKEETITVSRKGASRTVDSDYWFSNASKGMRKAGWRKV